MTQTMTIDIVSDVSCPWCVIGVGGLEEALRRVGDDVQAEIRFQPFELNPDMPAGGENIVEHIGRKYGSTPEQSAKNREMIRARAAEVGFVMAMSDQSRIYNTFDAHRLLHWAGLKGEQRALKHALFTAYFTDGKDPGASDALVEAAAVARLDPTEARQVLDTGRYADEVRQAERFWREAGISAVPAFIINDKYLISGGQPADAFERALRTIAQEGGAQSS
ncbi:DsbA family oxidoreductase [Phenylobacterium deserti]|uniref:DsbA family oxidoreductase n=1 Tax=Phenylobacterium deserti TaxID=1914756 RepID=A0A328AP13_9CAUL|nr:DsbA family oxidoreductase [Phenylobacterium deserti]RAK56690.1 DsbA family oxidoreductase [Phenylobacterium deserti]